MADEYLIRVAKTEKDFKEASKLIEEMYEWRGYNVEKDSLHSNEFSVTIVANEVERVIGTFTITFDYKNNNLYSDYAYPDIIEVMRSSGARICEITKFAISKEIKSRKFIVALFSVLFTLAHTHNSTDIIIEVNPRHEKYYQRMIGFNYLASSAVCERVGAPGILMGANVDYIKEQMGKSHGLYASSFTPIELEKIRIALISNKDCLVNIENSTFQILV